MQTGVFLIFSLKYIKTNILTFHGRFRREFEAWLETYRVIQCHICNVIFYHPIICKSVCIGVITIYFVHLPFETIFVWAICHKVIDTKKWNLPFMDLTFCIKNWMNRIYVISKSVLVVVHITLILKFGIRTHKILNYIKIWSLKLYHFKRNFSSTLRLETSYFCNEKIPIEIRNSH